MAEDEEAWFDEEEEGITIIYTDPFTSSPTPSLNSLPLPSFPSSPPLPSTTSTPSPPPNPPTPHSAPLTSVTTSTPSPLPPAPSPFTQVSYSPRPPAVLNRAPLTESSAVKAPIVTQVCVCVCVYTYIGKGLLLFSRSENFLRNFPSVATICERFFHEI